MAKHARLAASSSERWMTCHASVRASEGRRSVSSWFAMEGTAAHAIAEACLVKAMDADQTLGARVYVHDEKDTVIVPAKVPEGGRMEQRLADEEYVRFEVDEEMAEGVQLFVDTVRNGGDPLGGNELRTECYLDMSWLDEDVGGTADAHWTPDSEGWINLYDLKYGAGVMVEVKGNTQQMIYAVGLIHLYPRARGVRMHIVQPRKAHEEGPVRHIDYTREELELFARQVAKDAKATRGRSPRYEAGEHCRFCPAKVGCAALAAKAQELARAEFGDAPEPSAQLPVPGDVRELAALLLWVPVLDAWIKQAEGDAQRLMEGGTEVPGFKLVRKRSNRRWRVDDDEVVANLRGCVPDADVLFTEPRIKSPAQMEKISKSVKGVVARLTEKPEGGLTIAHHTDARPAVDLKALARAAFDDADPLA